MSRKFIGIAIRDNLNMWVSHPDPDHKPCYEEDANRRHIWTGEDAEAHARAFIRKARTLKGHGLKSEVRYCLVKVFRIDSKPEEAAPPPPTEPGTTLANATIRYFAAGQQKSLFSKKCAASAIHAITAPRVNGKHAPQDHHLEESKRVHEEFRAAEELFKRALTTYATEVQSSLPQYIPIEIGEHHAKTMASIDWLGSMGMRL